MIYVNKSLLLLFYVLSGREKIKSEKNSWIITVIEYWAAGETEKKRRKKMKENTEVMLRQAANSLSTVQVPIHMADLQTRYGHKSGDIEVQQAESCRHNAGHNNDPGD